MEGTTDPTPTDDDDVRARRIRRSIGIGIPTLVAGVLAGLLGIPWWIVAIVVVVIGIGIVVEF